MEYSPNTSEQRPAFVRACKNRKRFVKDILRSVHDPRDFKNLYTYIFPDHPAPNVKLPEGYRGILESTLMDGS